MEQNLKQPPPPFSCTYAPNVPELLQQMDVSLAISTYQAGKVILLSPKNRDEIIQLPRNFPKPMGIAVKGQKMAIATLDEVVILRNSPSLADNYRNQPKVYDSFFVPQASYYTGKIDIHDITWGKRGLYAVNTMFSNISLINDDYSFEPIWNPEFISESVPEDRCHLNGMAMVDDEPKYVTMLGKSNQRAGWREHKAKGGLIMDIDSGEVICDGLAMPHSPRFYNNNLYVLLSGTGELAQVDRISGKVDVVKTFNGFVRGLDKWGDYLFIGLSKLRTTSKAFQELPVSKKSAFAGIVIVHLPSMSNVGYIKYEASVDEIFDVRVIPGVQRPGILSTLKPDFKHAVTSPEMSMWMVPKEEEE